MAAVGAGACLADDMGLEAGDGEVSARLRRLVLPILLRRTRQCCARPY